MFNDSNIITASHFMNSYQCRIHNICRVFSIYYILPQKMSQSFVLCGMVHGNVILLVLPAVIQSTIYFKYP